MDCYVICIYYSSCFCIFIILYLVKNIIGYRCGFLNNIVKVVEIFGRIFMVVEFILIICIFIFYGLIGYKLFRIK